jgi:hypothetical protein
MLTSRYAMWIGWDRTFSSSITTLRDTVARREATVGARPAGARGVGGDLAADRAAHRQVLRTGEATWDEGLLLFLERNGYPKRRTTPSRTARCPTTRAIAGNFCVVTEETERVIGERRLASLRISPPAWRPPPTLARCSPPSSCRRREPRDMPFAMIYRSTRSAQAPARARRHSAAHPAARPSSTRRAGAIWPFARSSPAAG